MSPLFTTSISVLFITYTPLFSDNCQIVKKKTTHIFHKTPRAFFKTIYLHRVKTYIRWLVFFPPHEVQVAVFSLSFLKISWWSTTRRAVPRHSGCCKHVLCEQTTVNKTISCVDSLLRLNEQGVRHGLLFLPHGTTNACAGRKRDPLPLMTTFTELVTRWKTCKTGVKEEKGEVSDGHGGVKKKTEWCIAEWTNSCGAVIHPERLLHVGAQEHFATAEGARVEVHMDAEGSTLIAVPIKLVRGDVGAACKHN